jgi:hypothetical protein
MADSLELQVATLSRQVRRLQVTVAVILLVGLGLLVSMDISAEDVRNLRARSLIIEDEAGRDRIVVGAPIPEPEGRRISPSVGLVINDENGAERFGVGLQANGRMVMGLDAPPGTGDDRNRERITLVADQKGGAYIRFLNRKTLVPGRIVLDDDDHLYLEFRGKKDGKAIARRIGFDGEEMVELR